MVDRREIEHIALLAKIDVSQKDAQYFQDIDLIIKMMDRVGEIKLTMDECPLDTEFSGIFREDIPKPSISRQAVLENAPEIEAGCVSVPKVRGKEE